MGYVRPARSSTPPDPEEVETDDLEADWLDERQQDELARSEPQDADLTGLDGPYPHQWQRIWTAAQILDCDDIASYMDYYWEMTNNSEEY